MSHESKLILFDAIILILIVAGLWLLFNGVAHAPLSSSFDHQDILIANFLTSGLGILIMVAVVFGTAFLMASLIWMTISGGSI